MERPAKDSQTRKAQRSIENNLLIRLLPRSWVKNALKRVYPEGLIISWTISTVAGIVLPIELAISAASNAIGWSNPVISICKIFLLAIFAIMAILSIAIESKAYKTRRFSATPYGTLLYAGTGKSIVSASLQLFQDNIRLSFTNPWVIAGVVHSDIHAFMDGYIGFSFTVLSWYIFWNVLILYGKLDPWLERITVLTNGINKLKNSVFKTFKKI